MKTKVEIEYDSEAKTAAISLGGGKQTLWRDVNLILTRDFADTEVGGWVGRAVGDAHFTFTARRAVEAPS